MRALLPPELRMMSDRYKQQCCCELCVEMDFLQSSLNRYRLHQLADLEQEYEEMPESTALEKDAKSLALANKVRYKLEAFDAGETLHAKGRDAASSIQCSPPEDFEDSRITKLKCALGNCNNCGNYCRPTAETKLGEADRKIMYYTYISLHTCSKCGPCDRGTKKCQRYDKKKTAKKRVLFILVNISFLKKIF